MKLVVKAPGSTDDLKKKLYCVSAGKEGGIPRVAVKCIYIRRKASGEGDFLDSN